MTESFRSISAATISNPLKGVDPSTQVRNGVKVSETVVEVLGEVKSYESMASDPALKEALSGVTDYLTMYGVWVLTPFTPTPDSRAIQQFTQVCASCTEGPS